MLLAAEIELAIEVQVQFEDERKAAGAWSLNEAAVLRLHVERIARTAFQHVGYRPILPERWQVARTENAVWRVPRHGACSAPRPGLVMPLDPQFSVQIVFSNIEFTKVMI
jgi:hypothetical protein